jgi:two-component system, chemotaxis family, CheB/CheR fusion protein
LLGVERSQLSKRPLLHFVAPTSQTVFLAFLEHVLAGSAKQACEALLLKQKGESFWATFHGAYAIAPRGLPRRFQVAVTDITALKRAEEAQRRLEELEERVRQRTLTIRTLAAELILVEQREKTHLAQVLHDHLQQLLVGARFLLERARQDCTECGQETLREADQILAQCLEEARTLSVELSPPILRTDGLAAALKWLGDWMRDKHGLTVEVTSATTPASLSSELSVLLYHAVRELLFNVVKHAEVKSAGVSIDCADAQLSIVVSDKGKGFDPARLQGAASSSGQFGLFWVRERLALLDGQVEIDSAPGRGSRFTLRVPLRQLVAGKTRAEKK